MQVKVDTRDQAGERLPRVAPARVADAASALDSVDPMAVDRVKYIIAVNDGRAVPAISPRVAPAAADPARVSHVAVVRAR
jgi:hypothetical protein